MQKRDPYRTAKRRYRRETGQRMRAASPLDYADSPEHAAAIARTTLGELAYRRDVTVPAIQAREAAARAKQEAEHSAAVATAEAERERDEQRDVLEQERARADELNSRVSALEAAVDTATKGQRDAERGR